MIEIDQKSLLARVRGDVTLGDAEKALAAVGLTLGLDPLQSAMTLSTWVASGLPGARDPWLDPADQILAGLEARFRDGRMLSIRPAPRRAVGPDLFSLFVGCQGRFGDVVEAWVRVHRVGVARPMAHPFAFPRDPPVSPEEAKILDAVDRTLFG